jgi:hypothetical protein
MKFYKSYLCVRTLPVPLIAAINGPAIGQCSLADDLLCTYNYHEHCCELITTRSATPTGVQRYLYRYNTMLLVQLRLTHICTNLACMLQS